MPTYTKIKRSYKSPLIAGSMLASGAVLFGLNGHASASSMDDYQQARVTVQVVATATAAAEQGNYQQPPGTQQTWPKPAETQDKHKQAAKHPAKPEHKPTGTQQPGKDWKPDTPHQKDGGKQNHLAPKPEPAKPAYKQHESDTVKPVVKHDNKQSSGWDKDRHESDKPKHDGYTNKRGSYKPSHDAQSYGSKDHDKSKDNHYTKPVVYASYKDDKKHDDGKRWADKHKVSSKKDDCQPADRHKHNYQPSRHESQQSYFPVKYEPKKADSKWDDRMWGNNQHKDDRKSYGVQTGWHDQGKKDDSHKGHKDRDHVNYTMKHENRHDHGSYGKQHHDHSSWQASKWDGYGKGDYDMSMNRHKPMVHTAMMHKPMQVHYAGAHAQHMNMRSTLQSALQEHAVLGVTALKAAYLNSPDKAAAMKALEHNNMTVVMAVDHAYPGVGHQLAPLWAAHNGYYVQYLTAAAKQDSQGKQAAKHELAQFANKASTVLAHKSYKLDKADLQHQFAVHGNQVTAIIDSMVAGNFDKVFALSHEAYQHMAMMAATLAAGSMA